MAAQLTRLAHKIAIQLHLNGRELYHLQFSLQTASPGTFGYTRILLVLISLVSESIYKTKLGIQVIDINLIIKQPCAAVTF
jgi:hypothetical protein